MKTVVLTKVYEVRESHITWSRTYQMYFSKEKAINEARKLNKEEEEFDPTYRSRFIVQEHTTGDTLVYKELED